MWSLLAQLAANSWYLMLSIEMNVESEKMSKDWYNEYLFLNHKSVPSIRLYLAVEGFSRLASTHGWEWKGNPDAVSTFTIPSLCLVPAPGPDSSAAPVNPPTPRTGVKWTYMEEFWTYSTIIQCWSNQLILTGILSTSPLFIHICLLASLYLTNIYNFIYICLLPHCTSSPLTGSSTAGPDVSH